MTPIIKLFTARFVITMIIGFIPKSFKFVYQSTDILCVYFFVVYEITPFPHRHKNKDGGENN